MYINPSGRAPTLDQPRRRSHPQQWCPCQEQQKDEKLPVVVTFASEIRHAMTAQGPGQSPTSPIILGQLHGPSIGGLRLLRLLPLNRSCLLQILILPLAGKSADGFEANVFREIGLRSSMEQSCGVCSGVIVVDINELVIVASRGALRYSGVST